MIEIVTFVLAYLLLFKGFEFLWYICYRSSYLAASTEDLVIVATNVFIFVAFLIYRHRTHKSRIAADAEKWLQMRLRKQDSLVAARRKKLHARLLWAPSVLTLVASAFIPEAIGVGGNLFVSRTTNLAKYRIHTPITWIIGSRTDSYLSVMTVPGIGRIGLRRYWHLDVPMSEMVLFPVPHPEEQLVRNVVLDDATVLEKHSFPFGDETLTCWDLIQNNPFVGPSPTDPSIAEIDCTTESDHFYAHFFGWRGDSHVFYQIIQDITFVK
jgi:hypothetical protein